MANRAVPMLRRFATESRSNAGEETRAGRKLRWPGAILYLSRVN